ncbi:MAG TPA: amidohydrolase family protein [Solirubrobacteraceae bacterium]|nr:amidohydrolase family protein [Solirubrobacteraceae bacterium]
MSRRLLIRGGTVVSDGASVPADVLISEGSIVAVGTIDLAADQVLDADGCLVIPGAVDAHTHIFGRVRDDGVSALCGGTTTALAFTDAEPGESPAAAARRLIKEQISGSPIDIAMHGVIWDPDSYREGDLRDLSDLGVTSVKLWLAYPELGIMADDAQAYRVIVEAAREGVLVQGHCENGGIIEALIDELRQQSRLGLRELPVARPIISESEAVHRLLAMAELAGADAYVVHLTCRRALEEIEHARQRGQTVGAEVCAHHLVLDDGVYGTPEAIRYVMAPPLRPKPESDALWGALAQGRIDVYASDHSHEPMHPDKAQAGDDLTAVPYGVPGIELRLALGFTFGVGRGRLSPERLVEVACGAPARAFGLFPRKGTVRPGADADLVVWDPAVRWTAGPDSRHDGLDYSPYDGLELEGGARMVVAGGELVVQEREFLGREQPGRFLPRPRRGARVLQIA